MKTYEDLSKTEKEKLMLFKLYSYPTLVIITALLLMSMMVAVAGVILVTFLPAWFSIGLIFLSLYLLFCTTLMLRKAQKENFLMFGWKNTIEDVFEITSTDVKNVTIERKEIWRKK